MKKRLFALFLFILMLIPLVSCKEPERLTGTHTNQVNKYILQEEQACFNFFWETQRAEDLKGAGLIPDRYPSNNLASIASVGFGLAAFPGFDTLEDLDLSLPGLLS